MSFAGFHTVSVERKNNFLFKYTYIYFFLRLLLSFSQGKHSAKRQKVISSRYACLDVSKLYTLLIYNNIFSPAQPGIFLFSTNDKSENVFEYSSIIASGMSYCGYVYALVVPYATIHMQRSAISDNSNIWQGYRFYRFILFFFCFAAQRKEEF